MRTVTAVPILELHQTRPDPALPETIDFYPDAWGRPFVLVRERVDDAFSWKGARRLYRLEDGSRRRLPLPDLPWLPMALPLSGERWMVTGSEWADAPDHHAALFDAHGERLATYDIGKGWQDVQITSSGKLWVSYYDQAVASKHPMSRNGLVCLDLGGNSLMRYVDLVERYGLPPIDDCYCLNVCSETEAWLQYSNTDFRYPLVRLVNFVPVGMWDYPAELADAIAVDGRRALMAGNLDRKDVLVLFDLATGRTEELVPVDPVGQRLPVARSLPQRGQGSRLYLRSEEAVYLVDLNDIA